MKHYRTYADFLNERFDGKIQKITVNASLSCPNRDGTIGLGGCIFCDNRSFNPSYCSGGGSITHQIEDGRKFFARKYSNMKFLVYFQAYTSTHGNISGLTELYCEALDNEDVVGIVIGTRPDCMSDALLDEVCKLRSEYHKEIIIEFGAESSHNSTLEAINRCHTWECTVDAVTRTKSHGLPVGLHLIMGLPGETIDMMMETVDKVNQLPIDSIKFHQLQVIKDTRLHKMIRSGEIKVNPFSLDEYLNLCIAIVRRLRPEIAIDRFTGQAPTDMLVAPKWGIKNYEFTNLLNNMLKQWD